MKVRIYVGSLHIPSPSVLNVSLKFSYFHMLVLNKSLALREIVPFLLRIDFCIAPVTKPNAFLLELRNLASEKEIFHNND